MHRLIRYPYLDATLDVENRHPLQDNQHLTLQLLYVPILYDYDQ